jgi:hypothetical protein
VALRPAPDGRAETGEKRLRKEPALRVKLAGASVRIYEVEVPNVYHGWEYAEGKNIRRTDGLAAVHDLARCRFLLGCCHSCCT